MHQGLSDAEVRERFARDGPNGLPVSRPRSVLRLMGDVVAEPMFLLLVACGAIYLAQIGRASCRERVCVPV